MKTTTLAALIVCLIATAASYGQHRPDALVGLAAPTLLERPEVGPELEYSNYLGLAIEPHSGRGLKVYKATKGMIARNAGLERGDIIVGVEGYYVDTMQELETALRDSYGSIEITVKDVNTGRWVNTTMTVPQVRPIINVPIDEPIIRVGNPVGANSSLGVSFEMLRDGGWKIDSITPGSVAEKINLTVGDTILKVNGTKVENLREANRVFKKSFTMVYDDAETGYRYTMKRSVWGG